MKKERGSYIIDVIIVVFIIYVLSQLITYIRGGISPSASRAGNAGQELKQLLLQDGTLREFAASGKTNSLFASRLRLNASSDSPEVLCAMTQRKKDKKLFHDVNTPSFHQNIDMVEIVFIHNSSDGDWNETEFSINGLEELSENDFDVTKKNVIQYVREHMSMCSTRNKNDLNIPLTNKI
jgi:hypothetical protein